MYLCFCVGVCYFSPQQALHFAVGQRRASCRRKGDDSLIVCGGIAGCCTTRVHRLVDPTGLRSFQAILLLRVLLSARQLQSFLSKGEGFLHRNSGSQCSDGCTRMPKMVSGSSGSSHVHEKCLAPGPMVKEQEERL